MPLILYAHPQSPPCRAVTLTLDLLDVDYEYRFLDLVNGAHKKPEFLQVINLDLTNIKLNSIYQKFTPQKCLGNLTTFLFFKFFTPNIDKLWKGLRLDKMN